jgi:hypothetical protein
MHETEGTEVQDLDKCRTASTGLDASTDTMNPENLVSVVSSPDDVTSGFHKLS